MPIRDPHVIMHQGVQAQLARCPDATHLLVWHTMVGRTAWPIDTWQIADLEVIGLYRGGVVVVVPTDSIWQIIALDRVDIVDVEAVRAELDAELRQGGPGAPDDEPRVEWRSDATYR